MIREWGDVLREYLKKIRGNRTQKSIAKECKIGISTYNMIETGERQQDMSLSVIEKLSSALGIPLDEFIKMEQEYKENSH